MTNHRRWHNLPEYKEFQDNHRNKMMGRKHSEKTKRRISEKLKGNRSDDEHPSWKGDSKLSYHYLHRWIKNHKPKPKRCEECGKEQEYLELANISGKYMRDINDYKYLCVRCHKEYDETLKAFIEGGKSTRLKKGHKNELRWSRSKISR